ncbi:MAG: hypothetical protein ABMA02_10410 [Saprospiraceae bacterium]
MQPLQGGTPQTVAQEVLDRLFATNGNYRFKKPKLSISLENGKVAAYSPWKNSIILDQKAYNICRAFGRDSLAALAYILGHELVHAYQTEIKSGRTQTNFLAYNHHYNTDTRIEKVADVQGLFNAYLAGYRSLEVMPDLIERIYKDYGLIGKNLPGYPTLEERKATTDEVLAIALDLRDLFESSNYLLIIGRHSLAATGYEYILQYYQGIEMHNNLGIAYTLSAQEFWNPSTDKYIYPLETDWNTKVGRGPQPDRSLEPQRADFLVKAVAQFQAATALDANYLPARVNQVCALTMMGQSAEALRYAEMHLLQHISGRKKAKDQEAEMAEMALGITYALFPGDTRRKEAAAIFQRLSASQYVVSALYAQQNLQILLHNEAKGKVLSSLPLPAALRQQIGLMELGRTGNFERTTIDDRNEIYFAKKRGAAGGSSTFVFANEDDGNLVSLMRFQNRNLADVSILPPEDDLSAVAYQNILASKTGFFLKSPADRAVLKVDSKGRVLELVKYVEHTTDSRQ